MIIVCSLAAYILGLGTTAAYRYAKSHTNTKEEPSDYDDWYLGV